MKKIAAHPLHAIWHPTLHRKVMDTPLVPQALTAVEDGAQLGIEFRQHVQRYNNCLRDINCQRIHTKLDEMFDFFFKRIGLSFTYTISIDLYANSSNAKLFAARMMMAPSPLPRP